MKFGFKEKLIAAAAGLVLVIAGWYFFIYSPKQKEVSDTKNAITNLQRQIAAAVVEPGTIEQLKEQIKELEEEARNNVTRFASMDNFQVTNQYIKDKIIDNDLEFKDIEFDKTVLLSAEEDSLALGIKKVPATILLSGEFLNIGSFLEEFPEYPFLIQAAELNMDTADDIYPRIEVRLKVYIFFQEKR